MPTKKEKPQSLKGFDELIEAHKKNANSIKMQSNKTFTQVNLLYKNDKFFHKLFNLMFEDFGWAATEIDTDCLIIYRLAKKYCKSGDK